MIELALATCFVLYVFIEEGQLFNNQYQHFIETVIPRTRINPKIVGGCILCTSFWIGVAITLFKISFIEVTWVEVFTPFYFAPMVSIFYGLLKNMQ